MLGVGQPTCPKSVQVQLHNQQWGVKPAEQLVVTYEQDWAGVAGVLVLT